MRPKSSHKRPKVGLGGCQVTEHDTAKIDGIPHARHHGIASPEERPVVRPRSSACSQAIGNRNRLPRRHRRAKNVAREIPFAHVQHAREVGSASFTCRRGRSRWGGRNRWSGRNRRGRRRTWRQIDESPSPSTSPAGRTGGKREILAIGRHRAAAYILGQVPVHLPCGLLEIALLDELDARKIELDEVPGVDADPLGKGYPGLACRHRMPDSRGRYIAFDDGLQRPFLVRQCKTSPADSCGTTRSRHQYLLVAATSRRFDGSIHSGHQLVAANRRASFVDWRRRHEAMSNERYRFSAGLLASSRADHVCR